MSSTTITPVTFTGVSNYASDFQNIIDKAVQVASVPLTQLQNQDATVLQQETDLSNLQTPMATLATDLTNLGNIASSGALSASSSNPDVATATDSGAIEPATYTINSVTSLAAAASETSTDGYADATTAPVSSTGTMNLVVGSNDYTINLTSGQNNLTGLVNAINESGAPVNASVLTTGTGSDPDYLSITANNPGATTLQLFDDPTGSNKNILTDNNQGSDAVFQLNGVPVDETTNNIDNVIPGLSFTLTGTSSTPITLSLQSDSSQLSNALQTLVTDYNSALTAVDQQVGTAAGSLSGDFLVRQMEQDLQQVASYITPGSTIQSLSDLGITFSDTGQASFDPSVIQGFSSQQLSAAFRFIGSSTSGLAALANNFTQLSDPVTGLIQLQEQQYQSNDQQLKDQISTLTTQINTMQTNLQQQLASADSSIAELENQQQSLTETLESVNFVDFGVQPSVQSA